jgi:hypothetical protein
MKAHIVQTWYSDASNKGKRSTSSAERGSRRGVKTQRHDSGETHRLDVNTDQT